MPDHNMSLPLGKYTVLDLTRARAGPTAVRQMADWGAKVIRVEAIDSAVNSLGFDRDGYDFQNLHRNKRSITLNLKDERGRKILGALVEKADVLVENFRPDVKKRLCIDHESLKEFNPKLIYASISGFGQSGPYSNRPGLDQIAQGLGGLMSITGHPGQGPMRVGIPIADLSAGIFLALGVVLALLQREDTGAGRWVHTSLLESQIAMLDFQAVRWLVDGEVPASVGNDHPTIMPAGVFDTSDGQINIQVSGGKMWQSLCDVLGQSALAQQSEFSSEQQRHINRAELKQQIEHLTRRFSTAELIVWLNDAGVPSGPVNNIKETFSDPQVKDLDMVTAIDHARLGEFDQIRSPINLSGLRRNNNEAAPELGADTDAILAEIGMNAQDIKELHEQGVV
ncbi:MAG: formyl-CoA transferase [Acidiferrobacteraceae bacterium]|jgi:formyl-CoA transferase|nr:formyl-CoA transferase [Acidiferrobacteraceae bacterium]MDP6079239.1 CoA transferase [Arenicellales bacterium]